MNNDKLTQGKKPYTLNLNDQITGKMLDNSRRLITQAQAAQAAMEAKYLEAKELFESVQKDWLEVKQQWDNLTEEIQAQEQIIASLQVFRKAPDQDKRLVVLSEGEKRQGSNFKKRINWTAEAEDVLAHEEQFLSPEALVTRIMNREHVKEAMKLMKSHPTSMRGTATVNLAKHGQDVAKGIYNSRNHKATLVFYKGLLGLVDWWDERGRVPKAEYMKPFMYQTQKQEEE